MHIVKRRNEGQVSAMMAVMLLTFLFFFCFVVNVGMLVNAKINLQNAADLAAYAGASVQARQLNTISYLNYEMRRQYKKFLFRYYVIGNAAQKGFPRTLAGNYTQTEPFWGPDPQNAVNYGVPVVCVIFNAQDNYCQLVTLPKVAIPPIGAFDSINQVLVSQLQQLENIRQQNCAEIAGTNDTILRLWLFNSDPTLARFKAATNTFPANQQQKLALIEGVTQGVGLIPRELILHRRIETVAGYVNTAPHQGVTAEAAQTLQSGPDPFAEERTINAFFSAYYTLGNHTFQDTGSIQMDELLPLQGAQPLLQLNDIAAAMDTWAITFDLTNLSTTSTGNTAADCHPRLSPISLAKVTVGVSKNPQIATYYAVRLKASARLLFNPFGSEVALTAYAAARPFGSRIGPPLQTADIVRENTVANGALGAGINLFNQIPNLPIAAENDNTLAGSGWDSASVLGTMLATGLPNAQVNAAAPTDPTGYDLAYETAMAPNPYESGKYNMLNDLPSEGAPITEQNFDSLGLTSLWAPVTPPANPGQLDADLAGDVAGLFPKAPAVAVTTGTAAPAFAQQAAQAQILMNAIKNDITNYLNSLRNPALGTSEDGESMNVARIRDPFAHRPTQTGGAPAPINLPTWLMINTQPDVLTSWNFANDAKTHSQNPKIGRQGYSVKFVSFQSLGTPEKMDTLGTPATNGIKGIDGITDLDLQVIDH